VAADRGQRHRLPGGLLDALPGNLVADSLDPLAVRQHRGGGHRHRRGDQGQGQKGQGQGDVRVVAQGGDGGTTDIGFGCLSGMFERNDDVLYICYDNGGYMNTGVQRSSRPRRRRRAPRPPCRSAPNPATLSARASSCR
jgi:pyruvate/2-oxoacid:ferredoxin oxidoreductase beta subunit